MLLAPLAELPNATSRPIFDKVGRQHPRLLARDDRALLILHVANVHRPKDSPTHTNVALQIQYDGTVTPVSVVRDGD